METYIINGVEVQYDTFDIVNMELFGTEVERLKDFADANKGKVYDTFAESVSDLRALCEGILDFFDCLLGEGMAKKIFGDRINAMLITNAYHDFVSEVSAAMAAGLRGDKASAPAMNREQRRAEDRARRREEAARRAAQRAAGNAE